MPMMTGGCQCGAVRFSCDGLGRPSICHCRMCQKAFGNAFAPLVPAKTVVWTRGAPKHFASSNKVQRGFCADCGTPLTYEYDGAPICLAIGAFDDAASIVPQIQFASEQRFDWCENISVIRERSAEEKARAAPFFDGIISNQHPDRETP